MDRSPYFRRAREDARFESDRMHAGELFSTDRLGCEVLALEPGQRHEPDVREDADGLLAVLDGRGAFVVDGSSLILEPGDVALAPAGAAHRVFANQGERLVVLAVTSRAPARAEIAPESSEPEVAEPPVLEPSRPVGSLVASAAGKTVLAGSVPIVGGPAEAPPELPVARPGATAVRAPGGSTSRVVSTASVFSAALNDLLAAKSSTDADPAPEIPETRRCRPRSSRVREPIVSAPETPPERPVPAVAAPAATAVATPPKGRDLLPEIFSKPTLR